jgi:hypothetical protein
MINKYPITIPNTLNPKDIDDCLNKEESFIKFLILLNIKFFIPLDKFTYTIC